MELLILGSNSAAFAYGRHHTAQILKYENKYFLIDCGEGTQIQFKKYHVKLSKLHCVLISHMHGDHYLGLTGLLNTMHLFGRKARLKIIGPPELREILSLQLKASKTTLTYPLEFIEWRPGESQEIYEDNKLTITTLPLYHKVPCSGFLFREKPKGRRIDRSALKGELSPVEAILLKEGKDVIDIHGQLKYKNSETTLPPRRSRSYAFCSDTKYLPTLPEKISEVDMLYHEASFLDEMSDRAETTKHSTARQAAMIARDARVGKLLIGHFSSRYKSLDPFLEEARPVFNNTFLAVEGETYPVTE